MDRLKETVRDFASRENKLHNEARRSLAIEQHRRDTAIEKGHQELSQRLSKEDARWHHAKDSLSCRHQKRTGAIAEAHKKSQKQHLERIDAREGGRIYKVQTQSLQAERTRKGEVTAAETNLESFKAKLAEADGRLYELELQAKKAFGGYGVFLRQLSSPKTQELPVEVGDHDALFAELLRQLEQGEKELRRFRRLPLPFLFRFRWLWIGLLLMAVGAAWLLPHFSFDVVAPWDATQIAAAILAVGWALHFVGRLHAAPVARAVSATLAKASQTHALCLEKSQAHYDQEVQRIEAVFQETSRRLQDEWNHAIDEAALQREALPGLLNEKKQRVLEKNSRLFQQQLNRLEEARARALSEIKQIAADQIAELNRACVDVSEKIQAGVEASLIAFQQEWRQKVSPLFEAVTEFNRQADTLCPSWDSAAWQTWRPGETFQQAVPFGRLTVDVEQFNESLPQDPCLALPGPPQFTLPLVLACPEEGSLLLETESQDREAAIRALNNIILRLLATAPPGRLGFTIFDPVGLGENFAWLMHLADYEEPLINSRIWTQSSQIEEKLADLNEHMEKVIQMYLRNEFESIADYNKQAGNIAERYQFLVIADFPAGFSEVALRRLKSIASIGARCGVYTLIHWDTRQALPPDFAPDTLRENSVCLCARNGKFLFQGKGIPGVATQLDEPPPAEAVSELIHKIGQWSVDSSRVEVPFSHVAPPQNELWTLDTASELRVPIGRTGATKLQYLALGKGTRQHALVAGKTGSGKSTLFHVIITNLALWCSPEQVEFYLIDFKKGVEFKCYAQNRLAHARVVAIESDREFGLSVLERLDEELKRRGEMFRMHGVQDLASFRRSAPEEPLPRTLLIIDEFQEFFVEEDRIAQNASMLLDRIVRQGRAFGIHVLLGSQTLGGAYTVARATLGQMAIRIALQCNEADAYLIMDDTNSAPRLLSRPGEGIYNDEGGSLQGNSPFQAVWLSDEVRDACLAQVSQQSIKSSVRRAAPVVFEGNAPSDVRENPLLQSLLDAEGVASAAAPRIWLGAPNAIKGPTEAVFHRQSGNHLLMVGQNDDSVLAILGIGLVSLAAQLSGNKTRFIVFDASVPGTPQRDYVEKVAQAVPHTVTLARSGDAETIFKELEQELQRRSDSDTPASEPTIFVMIHGLQKFNRLRYEEDFGFSSGDAGAPPNPGAQLNRLIQEGAARGIHMIVTCDTWNNVNRFLSRKALSEFELRVLFQMSATDSASLIDSPKASTLGLHRALFYNEQEGRVEIFRPYAKPPGDWIEAADQSLRRLI